MTNAYFQSALALDTVGESSVQLNNGAQNLLPYLFTPGRDNPYVSYPIEANPKKDVFSLSGLNQVVIRTNTHVTMTWDVDASGAMPSLDIQFLIFDNNLVARQGQFTGTIKVTQNQ